MKAKKPAVKEYDALSQNFFRQLARGNAVAYRSFLVETKEDKIIVKRRWQGKDLELHFRRRPGDDYGFSKEQFRAIFADREKPMYRVTVRARPQ